MSLINEDRKFGGNKLYFDYIPPSCINLSLSKQIPKQDLLKIILETLKKANIKCEFCNSKKDLQMIEKWYYNDRYHQRELKRCICVCNECKNVIYIPSSSDTINYEKAKNHYMKINNCSEKEFIHDKFSAIRKYKERSRYIWSNAKYEFKYPEISKQDEMNDGAIHTFENIVDNTLKNLANK